MSITLTTAKTRLARLMGDATSAGVASFAKWAETEYEDAINFAIELLREKFLIPTAADLTWATDDYDYSVPGSLVYLLRARAESNSNIALRAPVAGTGLFEYWVPLDIISVQRTNAGALSIHFDKQEVARHSLNQNGLLIRMEGYKYQAEVSAGADTIDIPWASVAMLAKMYLHLGAQGRDPNELMKHARQIQQALTVIGSYNDEEIEAPGGIWLDK